MNRNTQAGAGPRTALVLGASGGVGGAVAEALNATAAETAPAAAIIVVANNFGVRCIRDLPILGRQ